MNTLRNIVVLIVAIALPFGMVNAQVKKKVASSKLRVASKKRQPSNVKRQPSNVDRQPLTIDRKDTTAAPKEVTITSSFKPSLRNAAKVNFTAATPILDTS